MSCVYEELEIKSKWVKVVIIGQIEYWIKYGLGKIIRNGCDLYWVKVKEDKIGFELIEDCVVIICEIISLFYKGWGMLKI